MPLRTNAGSSGGLLERPGRIQTMPSFAPLRWRFRRRRPCRRDGCPAWVRCANRFPARPGCQWVSRRAEPGMADEGRPAMVERPSVPWREDDPGLWATVSGASARTTDGWTRQQTMGHRLFLGAALLGVALTLITEGLNLLGGIARGWIVASWAVAFGIGLWARRRPVAGTPPSAPTRPMPRAAFVAVGSILGLTATIALLAPPNNWDSMTYHMPRVAHWAQAGSVAHYPTHILRQLWLGPWAEFGILHLYVLAGGDRLANLVQWLAFAG